MGRREGEERNIYDTSAVGGVRNVLPLKEALLTKSGRSTRKRLISKNSKQTLA